MTINGSTKSTGLDPARVREIMGPGFYAHLKSDLFLRIASQQR